MRTSGTRPQLHTLSFLGENQRIRKTQYIGENAGMRTSGTRPLSYGMAPKLYSLRLSGYMQRPAIAPPFAFASVLRPSHSASGCTLSWRFALFPRSSAPPCPHSPHPQAHQLAPGIGASCFAPAYPLRGFR